MATKTKGRNYRATEKQFFLEILKAYAYIIESKKSTSASLQQKEQAWAEICEQYNSSPIVEEPRNIFQLKKLWTNLKQGQKAALIKKKQSLLTTHNSLIEAPLKTDPMVAEIAPNVYSSSVPGQISNGQSNMTVTEEHLTVDDLIRESEEEMVVESLEKDTEIIEEVTEEITEEHEEEPSTSVSTLSAVQKHLNSKTNDVTRHKKERIERLMDYDRRLYLLKERHEKEMHAYVMQRLKEKCDLEITMMKASAGVTESSMNESEEQ